jgi:ABC-type amino acid transport substrate-binding protein
MFTSLFGSKFCWLILLVGLSAAQCQATPQPAPLPTSPPPTPLLIPPIQPGDGSDLIDRLLETGVIRVGIRVWPEAVFSPPAFRGFSNAETGGALNGFEVDLARLVAEGLGLELELVEAYPPVIATGDWRGQWDIAIASLVPFDQPAESAGQKLVFSKPYAYIPMGILKPAAENNIQALGDLSGRRVGVLEHSAYQRLLSPGGSALTVQQQPLLPQIPADMQPVALSNLLKAIRQLGQAEPEPEFRVDAIFGPAPIFQEAVKGDLPVRWVQVGVQPLAIAAVAPDNLKVDRLILEVNKILERLDRQGTLAEMYLRWYGQDFSQVEDRK